MLMLFTYIHSTEKEDIRAGMHLLCLFSNINRIMYICKLNVSNVQFEYIVLSLLSCVYSVPPIRSRYMFIRNLKRSEKLSISYPLPF